MLNMVRHIMNKMHLWQWDKIPTNKPYSKNCCNNPYNGVFPTCIICIMSLHCQYNTLVYMWGRWCCLCKLHSWRQNISYSFCLSSCNNTLDCRRYRLWRINMLHIGLDKVYNYLLNEYDNNRLDSLSKL